MSARMRTQAMLLAAELQRRRTDKTHRFTTNSVFRVAIEAFLRRVRLTAEDHINSDEELLRFVQAQLNGTTPVDRTGSA